METHKNYLEMNNLKIDKRFLIILALIVEYVACSKISSKSFHLRCPKIPHLTKVNNIYCKSFCYKSFGAFHDPFFLTTGHFSDDSIS